VRQYGTIQPMEKVHEQQHFIVPASNFYFVR
jgi:hypothetical protein